MKNYVKVMFLIMVFCFVGLSSGSLLMSNDIPDHSIIIQGYLDYTDYHLIGQSNYLIGRIKAFFRIDKDIPYKIVDIKVNGVSYSGEKATGYNFLLRPFSLKSGDTISVKVGYVTKKGIPGQIKYIEIASMPVKSLVTGILLPANRSNVVLDFYNDTVPIKWRVEGQKRSTHFALFETKPPQLQKISYSGGNVIVSTTVNSDNYSVAKRVLSRNKTYYIYLGIYGSGNNSFTFTNKVDQSSWIEWSSGLVGDIKTK